jgi:cell division protein FtsZ
MTINLHLPTPLDTLRPTITVVGVGGAGGNAVNNMIAANLEGVNFVVANTDAQALEHALTERRILLGTASTRGLGAGGKPEVGRVSAEESAEDLISQIEGSNMVFITAGMGGGTGTGAAPVVARMAKELGILTVAVVTKPFGFEGPVRMRQADSGLEELHRYVDTVIVIPNQNLFRVANEKTTFADAFRMADEVLHSGVRGVTDLITMPGLINLDFADIRSVMEQMGKAIMGTGEATGDRRAIDAAEAAISNPLLDDVSMKGAKGVLINITGGHDMTLFEVDEAANRIRQEVDAEANIIFGSTFNPNMENRMRVSVVATGIEGAETLAAAQNAQQNKAASAASAPANRFAPRPADARAVDAPRAAVFDFRNTPPAKPVARPAATAPASAPAAAEAPAAADEFAETAYEAPAAAAPAAATAPRAAQAPAQQDAVASQPRTAAPAAPAQRAATAQAEGYASPAAARQGGYAQAGSAAVDYQPESYREMSENISPRKSGHDAKGSGLGLLDRLGSISRAFGGRGEAEIEHEAPSPRSERSERKAEVRSAAATGAADEASDEEYIDIPAFLRRQAN